jgi:hypothetical protein
VRQHVSTSTLLTGHLKIDPDPLGFQLKGRFQRCCPGPQMIGRRYST